MSNKPPGTITLRLPIEAVALLIALLVENARLIADRTVGLNDAEHEAVDRIMGIVSILEAARDVQARGAWIGR